MPDQWKDFNVSVMRVATGNGHETSASVGEYTMKLVEEFNIRDSATVRFLFTSNFLDKVLISFSQADKLAKFSIRNGSDHLCIDVQYQHSLPNFNADVEIRSNKIPGEKMNMGTSYDGNSKKFKFFVDYDSGRAMDMDVSVPNDFAGKSGSIIMTVKTASPLPAIDARIEVSYSFDSDQTASLQGSVNGKAASVSLRRQTGDGKDITKMNLESPVQNVEATLSFSSEWEWSLEVTSDAFSSKISLEMAEEDKMEMRFESSTYSGKAEWELTNYVSNNKIKFDSELENKATGDKKFMKIEAEMEGTEVEVGMKSSIPGFEDVKATGTVEETPQGYVFSATGDVGSEGYAFSAVYSRDQELGNDQTGNAVTLRADYGSKYIEVRGQTTLGDNNASASLKIRGSGGRKFDVSISGSNTDSGVEVTGDVTANENTVLLANLLLENSGKQKGLAVTFKSASGTLVDLQGVIAFDGSRVSLRTAAALPALGLDEDTFKANFAFQPLETADGGIKFEVLGDLVLMGTPRKIVLKLSNKGYNAAIEMGLTAFGQAYSLKMGSEVTGSNGQPTTWRFYLNSMELVYEDAMHTPNNFASVRLVLKGDVDLNVIGAGSTDIGLTEVFAKFSSVGHGYKLEINANSDKLFSGSVGSKIVIRDRAYGTSGLEVAASVDVDVNGINKKVALSVEANEKGCMEVTYGNGPNNKVVLALNRSKRSAEATVMNEELGNYELKIGDLLTNGYFTLSTSQGQHKVSYLLDQEDGYGFNIEVDSPWLDDKVAGEFHLGSKRVGAAYEVNRVKREIGLEYDMDDTKAHVTLKTPFQDYRKLSIRSANPTKSQYEFSFEADMDSHEASFGLMYEFSMEKGGVVLVRYNFDGENGEIGLNLSSPNNLPTLDSQLYFIKGDSNVFQLTSKVAKDGDWMNLEMKGMYLGASVADVLMRINVAMMDNMDVKLKMGPSEYSAKLSRKGTEDFELVMQTPIPGYESMVLTYQNKGGQLREIELTKNKKSIMTLTMRPDFSGPTYGIKLDFKLMQIWARLDCQANVDLQKDLGLKIVLKTSNSDYSNMIFRIRRLSEGNKVNWQIEIRHNDLFYQENSVGTGCWEMQAGGVDCTVKDEVKTNFPFLEYASTVSETKIEMKDGFSSHDIAYNYKAEDDAGAIIASSDIKMRAKLFSSLLFKATGQFKQGSWTGMKGKFDSEIKIAKGATMKQGIKMLVKAFGQNIRLIVKEADGEYKAQINTSIPGYEKLEGLAVVKDKGMETKMVNLKMKKNGGDMIEVKYQRTTDFMTSFDAKIEVISGSVKQALGLEAKKGTDGYVVKLYTQGSHSNIAAECNSNLEYSNAASGVLTATGSIKGDGIFVQGIDYQMGLKASFDKDGGSGDNNSNLELTFEDNANKKQWKVTMEHSILGKDFKASAAIDSPSGSPIKPMRINVSSQYVMLYPEMSLNIGWTVRAGDIVYMKMKDLGFVFDSSNYHAKVGFDCKVQGNAYKVMGEADSYKTIEVTLDLPLEGTGLGRFSIKCINDFKGGLDFNSELLLATPWTETYGISMQGTPSGNGFDINGR